MNKYLEKKTDTDNITKESELDVNKIIDKMTLFDDDLMSLVFDKNIPATELILKIILGMDIKVKHVNKQVEKKNPNPYGRSITLDIEAIDANGSDIDIEVQGNANGAHVKRARYHSSVIDSGLLKKKQAFKRIPDSYVIFIYKNDKFKKGLPLYHIDRFVNETREAFNDGSHIIYVNGKYKGNDDIGKLMSDFNCKSANKMQFEALANSVRHFKETEKGREVMSGVVEKYGNKREAIGKQIGKQIGKENTKIEDIKNLMETLALSLEQALDALKITGKERTAIIGKLQK